MNGRQLNQGLLGSLHISPVQPTFEPQSVPYYLQQDLEALQRVSQQHTSASSLSQQTSPRSQTSLLTTPSSPHNGGLRAKRLERNGRRLSLDPYTRLRVEKLEVVGLNYLLSSFHSRSKNVSMISYVWKDTCYHYHHKGNASFVADVCTDFTPREPTIANGQGSLGLFLLLQLSNTFVRNLSAPNKAVFSNKPILTW